MTTTIARPELSLRSLDASWDRARWRQLPADGNRYEVIDGVLYMTTAPSFFHQWIVKRINSRLEQQIDETGWGLTIFAPVGLFMPGTDPVQPDLLVIAAADFGIIRGGDIEGIPALIVEVQSPSHPELDSRVKLPAYARAGVPEYWMVRPATREVIMCSEPDRATGEYLTTVRFRETEELVSATLPVRFPVAYLFAGSPDTTL